MKRANQVFTGNLTDKELNLIEDALEISSSVKVYGEGREEHQKECANVILKLYREFWEK